MARLPAQVKSRQFVRGRLVRLATRPALPCPARRYAAFYLQTDSVMLLRSITSGCEGWVAWTGLRSVIREKCDIFIKEVRTRQQASGYISARLPNFQMADRTSPLRSSLKISRRSPTGGRQLARGLRRCPKHLTCSRPTALRQSCPASSISSSSSSSTLRVSDFGAVICSMTMSPGKPGQRQCP